MRRVLFPLLCAALTLLFAAEVRAESRVALVIGISNYQSLSKLNNPVPDAKAIAAALKSHGFEVTEEYDLPRAELLDAIEEFSDKAGQASVALVYYAGHGMEMAGRNVLAPTDMEIDCEKKTPRRAIELDQIFSAVSGAPQQIVLLDACRNDPFPQCPARSAGAGSGFRGFSRVAAEGRSLLIANATLSGQLAADGDVGKHSPFAGALLARFTTDSRAYLRDLLDLTAGDVSKASKGGQVPEILTRGGAPRVCLEEENCGNPQQAAATPQAQPLATLPSAPSRAADPSQLDRAARGWADVQGTESKAVLEAYVKEFPEGFYTELARSKLEVLKQREQQAAVAPAAPATPQPTVAPPSSASSWELLRTIDAQSSLIMDLVFSPDGSMIATGDADNLIHLWDAASGAQLRVLKGHSGWVKSLSFSLDGKMLASGSADKTIKLWTPASGALLRTLSGHADELNGVAFAPDGGSVASADNDKTTIVWDAGSGKQIWKTLGELFTECVAFSPDGTVLAHGTGSTLVFSDARSGKTLQTNDTNGGFITSMAFSRDGTALAMSGYGNSVTLWDIKGRKVRRSFAGNTGPANSVSVSPDGKLIASASDDKAVRVWDVNSGELLQTLTGLGEVNAVAFSPDGRLLAAGDDDSKIAIWSVGATQTSGR